MSTPFIRKEKGGFLINLHQALYPGSAVDAFQKTDPHVVVGRKGAYWSLRFSGSDAIRPLEALDQLLFLSKGHRSK